MCKTTLAILAAGIGSRYGGGIKQMDPLGPGGEIMMDFSIHDALEAGFNKIVFIIRHDLDEDFRELIGNRISEVAEVAYAYQELTDLPEGFELPAGRTKPWGTGQALLAAADVIDEPFAVINADDYYGKEGFRMLHEFLTTEKPEEGIHSIAMAAFVLGNTLSDNGGVTRGIVSMDEEGNLNGITETRNIVRTPDGAAIQSDAGLTPVDTENLVSMNMWGLYPDFLDELKTGFPQFLKEYTPESAKQEYLLPVIIDELVKAGRADVKVLRSGDTWFGVTYREDKESVKEEIAKLMEQGVYREPLYSDL